MQPPVRSESEAEVARAQRRRMLPGPDALAGVALGWRKRGKSCVPIDAPLQSQTAKQQRGSGFCAEAPGGICDDLRHRHVSDLFSTSEKTTIRTRCSKD